MSMNREAERNDCFATTRWSVVLTAGGDRTHAQKALEELFQSYWYPLYVYVRRKGYSPQDAEDHTQAFFVHVMEREMLASAQRERGRIRAFLLASLRNFLNDDRRRANALKRKAHVVSLDKAAESRYRTDAVKQETPEQAFARQWALRCLTEVLQRLEREYADAGKTELYEHLRCFLTNQGEAVPHAEVAKRLGKTEGAVKAAAHQFRQRYRKLLRAQIAETVASPEDIEDELRYLISVLAR